MPHYRRKSGNVSMTDVRRAVTATDPSAKHRRLVIIRRTTPGTAQKLGRSNRERERDGHDFCDEESDSFPQFCMICEKQFLPQDEKFLYCSETCRSWDQQQSAKRSSFSAQAQMLSYDGYTVGRSEPKDIIPRVSPSRPLPLPSSDSPRPSPTDLFQSSNLHCTSAVSALRSLIVTPPSPPSPPGGSSIALWPFGRSTGRPSEKVHVQSSVKSLSSTPDSSYRYGSGGPAYYTFESTLCNQDRTLPSRYPSAFERPKDIGLLMPTVEF